MKKHLLKYSIAALVAISFSPAISCFSQDIPPAPVVPAVLIVTNAPTPTPAIPTSGSFFATAQNYFTSFNPDLDSTFGTQRGEVAVGVDSIQGGGVNLANSIRFSYNAYKIISVEAVVRDSGISGIFVSEQVGPALNFVIHDAKLTLYAHGGYHQEKPADDASRLYGEIGVRAQKALTAHTFAGVGLGVQIPGSVRTFSAFTGFTF